MNNKTQEKHIDPIKDKYYKHFLYVLILPVYLAGFFFIESIETKQYFVSYMPIDDLIPFCEYFVVFYILWFPYIALPGFHLLLKDAGGFRKYMIYVAASFMPVLIFCFLFPNGQDLRPEAFAHDNIFTQLVAALYAADTNTNVLPSIHVVGTFAAIFSLYENRCFSKYKAVKVCGVIIGFLICISTVFIKQHSMLDCITAVPYSFIVWFLVYRLPKIINKHKRNR